MVLISARSSPPSFLDGAPRFADTSGKKKKTHKEAALPPQLAAPLLRCRLFHYTEHNCLPECVVAATALLEIRNDQRHNSLL